MKCPKCSNQKDKVVDSRSVRNGEAIRRRRICLGCNHRFTTYEEIAKMNLRVVKRDGILEDFDRQKLERGLGQACVNTSVTEQQVSDLTDLIIAKLQAENDKEVNSIAIGRQVMQQLLKLDQVAFVRFASVYRRYSDVNQYLNEISEMMEEQKGDTP